MTALAIGNFDGLHKGHQKIINALLKENRKGEVLTFEPHPRRFFAPEGEPFLLTPAPIKERLLKQMGISEIHFARFDRKMASLSPQGFVTDVLLRRFKAEVVVVGRRFVFGKGRTGDSAVITALGERYGFKTVVVEELKNGDVPYSSTLVRRHIQNGEMEAAAFVLGRPFAIEAPVVKGSGRGTGLGSPTVNLDITRHSYLPPKCGVYAATCQGKKVVVNYGYRPTFGGDSKVMEAHFIEGKPPPAAESLDIELLSYLREEKRFSAPKALKAQIKQDIRQAEVILAKS